MLLIYADSAANAQLLKQQQLLEINAAGLKKRDIQIKVYLKSASPEEFRAKHIQANFTVILVGKDGGEKLRTTDVLMPRKLFATVDAMPMRKQEMKN
jgi:hypothetical protein